MILSWPRWGVGNVSRDPVPQDPVVPEQQTGHLFQNAINLRNVAARYAETAERRNACGDAVSLVFEFFREVEDKLASMKQEPSSRLPERVVA